MVIGVAIIKYGGRDQVAELTIIVEMLIWKMQMIAIKKANIVLSILLQER